MTLPISPASISMSQLNIEMNQSAIQLVTLNDPMMRSLAGKPTADTTISLSDFRGKSRSTGTQTITTPGTTYWTVPYGVYSITASVYGGGGGGSSVSFCGDGYSGGGGGSGSYSVDKLIAVTPGDYLTLVCGAGGAGGPAPAVCVGHNSGGAGGNSYVSKGANVLVAAYGGGGGQVAGCYPCPGNGGAGGAAGTLNGSAGSNGGAGGAAQPLTGGAGGINVTSIGSGGSGGAGGGGGIAGKNGAVKITW
jgi:hypothetical protein